VSQPQSSVERGDPGECRERAATEEPEALDALDVEDRRCRTQHQAVQTFGVALPDELRDRTAHRVADGDETIDSERGGHVDGIVGAVLQPEPLLRADSRTVAAMIERDDAVSFSERLVALEPIEVGGCGPSVEQDDGRLGVARAEVTDQDRPASGEVDEAGVRQVGNGDRVVVRVADRRVGARRSALGVKVVGEVGRVEQRLDGAQVGDAVVVRRVVGCLVVVAVFVGRGTPPAAQVVSTFNTLTVSAPFGAS